MKRNSMANKRSKFHIASARIAADKKVTLTTVVIGALIIVLGIILRSWRTAGMSPSTYLEAISSVPFWGKLHRLGSEEGLTLYLSQLSFTFITISVMSVLSDSSVVIYWENIVKKKLIEPVWSCFHAYTTYSFATVIFGGIAALIGLPFIFLLFFVTDIIVLMALTFSMIDVYFRHDEKARKLEKEFRELVETEDAPMEVLKRNYEKYLKITSKLRTNTILALKDYDSPTVEENFRFYARNATYIPKRDFETIMKCVDEINISDYTEWLDYYAGIAYKEGTVPEVHAQPYVSEVMCRGFDLFSFMFNQNVLPLFAKASDSVSAERMFWAYKEFARREREALKKTKGDEYDRKKHSPAASFTRSLLLRGLLEAMKSGDEDFVFSFLNSFKETNMLTNYDYDDVDEYVWEEYFKTIPEEEAQDRLDKIYPVTEILYGEEYPQCVREAVGFVWGNFDDVVRRGFQKSEPYEGFRTVGEELQEASEEEHPDEYQDEEYDDWKHYCEVYGQEYVGWPPENDNCGFFTYEGREVYGRCYEYGELNDGDLPK